MSGVLLLFSLLLRKDRKRREEQVNQIKDSEIMRQELSKWEPLILDDCGTIRGLKMFANRVRLICARENITRTKQNRGIRSQISFWVGFSAIVNMKLIEQRHFFSDDKAFNVCFCEIRKNVLCKLSTINAELGTQAQIKFFFKQVRRTDWEEFAKIASFVRFPSDRDKTTTQKEK